MGNVICNRLRDIGDHLYQENLELLAITSSSMRHTRAEIVEEWARLYDFENLTDEDLEEIQKECIERAAGSEKSIAAFKRIFADMNFEETKIESLVNCVITAPPEKRPLIKELINVWVQSERIRNLDNSDLALTGSSDVTVTKRVKNLQFRSLITNLIGFEVDMDALTDQLVQLSSKKEASYRVKDLLDVTGAIVVSDDVNEVEKPVRIQPKKSKRRPEAVAASLP